MNRRKRVQCKLMLVVGGLVLGLGGNCMPNNFWISQWENTVGSVVETAVAGTIIPVVEGALNTGTN